MTSSRVCQESGKVQYNKAGILLFWGVHAQEIPGENLRSDSTLHIRAPLHDLVTDGIPHSGSRQVRFVLSFFVFPLQGKAESGGNPVC